MISSHSTNTTASMNLTPSDARQIASGDGQQPSDDIAGSGHQEESEEPQPHHFDIVPPNSGGDVIWECKDKVSFLVSSAVLRLTSRYFKTLLDGEFMEGRVRRSATNPQKIPSGEENSHALHRLFCFLHHQPDPDPDQSLIDLSGVERTRRAASDARKLRDLAAVVDYFECSEALSKITDSMLHELSMPMIRDRMSFQATADLVSAACTLENSRYFRLFTKRLLTDHTERFEDTELTVGSLDTNIMLELSRQSTSAWRILLEGMQHLGESDCTAYRHQHIDNVSDHLWMQKLSACLLPPSTAWPTCRENGVSLRRMLSGIYRLERIQRVSWCTRHKAQIFGSVDQRDFAFICSLTDAEVSGVCLTCVRSPKDGSVICRCGNEADTMESLGAKIFVSKDSFLVKA